MRFDDYHRTIVGYHGTKLSTALDIVARKQSFKRSENRDEWLGHGIYFWEYAPQQAFWWAKRRQKRQNWKEPIAILAAMIRLGFCFDLLDRTMSSICGKFTTSIWNWRSWQAEAFDKTPIITSTLIARFFNTPTPPLRRHFQVNESIPPEQYMSPRVRARVFGSVVGSPTMLTYKFVSGMRPAY